RVIAGHKRFLACRKLGWKTVPVVVQSAVTPETPVAGDDAAGLPARP
ncbi:MAG: ParB N-terminal domain-containing protein, partial [Lentisphaerae bacterium]|nr:ParB N-terminal domain-containing protein [Lentisphaerota bacterium]